MELSVVATTVESFSEGSKIGVVSEEDFVVVSGVVVVVVVEVVEETRDKVVEIFNVVVVVESSISGSVGSSLSGSVVSLISISITVHSLSSPVASSSIRCFLHVGSQSFFSTGLTSDDDGGHGRYSVLLLSRQVLEREACGSRYPMLFVSIESVDSISGGHGVVRILLTGRSTFVVDITGHTSSLVVVLISGSTSLGPLSCGCGCGCTASSGGVCGNRVVVCIPEYESVVMMSEIIAEEYASVVIILEFIAGYESVAIALGEFMLAG